MTGYWINDFARVGWLALLICTIPLAGYWVAAIRRLSIARVVAWGLVIGSVLIVERASQFEPHGTRMLLIIVALLWSMKAVVYVETRNDGKCKLTCGQWFGFCVGWFGMRAAAFSNVPAKPLSDSSVYIQRGLARASVGIVLVLAARLVANGGLERNVDKEMWRVWMATALLLPGLSLVVHFGLFNVLTGIWRYCGARCTALFRAPLSSRSLGEFWGRRWNLAFSEMTALAVFRPLKQLPGSPRQVTVVATAGAFLFSGLLHELAISVPVGSGFGLPLLYFAIQGIGTLIETRLRFINSGLAGTIWTGAWVLLPMPILFHRPFLQGCVWPIISF